MSVARTGRKRDHQRQAILKTVLLFAPCLLMTFTISFDEFFMAFFLSGTEATLPMYIWGQLRFPQDFPSLLALATLILVFSFVLVFTSLRLGRISQSLQNQTGGRA